MSFLRKNFQLGSAVLPNNVFYSPLAGCSDFPFRRMSSRLGRPGLHYCEMVKMEALVRHDPNTFHLLDYDASMYPVGAQLVGGNAAIAGLAARMIEDLGFAVVDLNCGCPVDKVTKDGSGSGLLRNPQRIGEIIANMVAAVKIPVTVKVRSGWDEADINAPEITRIAEAAGAQAIAIHGRTRKQAYRGPADWEVIRASKEAAGSIKVIGNGDVFSPEAAERMFQQTGCDAVLCSRGTMGAPWLAADIVDYLSGKPVPPRSQEDYQQALVQHFEEMIRYLPPQKVVVEMRRVGCWYIKRNAGTREFRAAVSKASSVNEIRQLIDSFLFVDAPGAV